MPIPKPIKKWLVGLYTVIEAAVLGGVVADYTSLKTFMRTGGLLIGYAILMYCRQSPFSKVLQEIVTETTTETTKLEPDAVVVTTVKKIETTPPEQPHA